MGDINVIAGNSDRIIIRARQYELDTEGVRVEIVEQRQAVAIRNVTKIAVEAVYKGFQGDPGISPEVLYGIEEEPVNAEDAPDGTVYYQYLP